MILFNTNYPHQSFDRQLALSVIRHNYELANRLDKYKQRMDWHAYPDTKPKKGGMKYVMYRRQDGLMMYGVNVWHRQANSWDDNNYSTHLGVIAWAHIPQGYKAILAKLEATNE